MRFHEHYLKSKAFSNYENRLVISPISCWNLYKGVAVTFELYKLCLIIEKMNGKVLQNIASKMKRKGLSSLKTKRTNWSKHLRGISTQEKFSTRLFCSLLFLPSNNLIRYGTKTLKYLNLLFKDTTLQCMKKEKKSFQSNWLPMVIIALLPGFSRANWLSQQQEKEEL